MSLLIKQAEQFAPIAVSHSLGTTLEKGGRACVALHRSLDPTKVRPRCARSVAIVARTAAAGKVRGKIVKNMRKQILGLAILAAASVAAACSYRPQPSSERVSDRKQSPAQGEPKIMVYSEGFPPPLGMVFGTFGVRNGCLALKPQTSENWYVAVVPPGSSFTRDHDGTPNGVILQGKTARFGETLRLGGGVSPYDLGEQGRACLGSTAIIDRVLG